MAERNARELEEGEKNHWGGQPQGAPDVEIAERNFAGLPHFVQQYRRDQIAAENEKDINANPPTGDELVVCVVKDNKDDRKCAHAVERWIVAHC
jgi:hypothetical protein